MKLLRINIHGFKSFADKVSLEIKPGITGIVGPNGSGKSNIVDAVKWVLGEQSLKDIRGGSTSSDIIFSGSKSRSPLTRAWVSLTFDNSDHYLNSDLTELEIKRVVYSSGENEYFINNESVRLKDITDLFIDSGSSVNSLSIISQGKIGEIINGTPLEKRSIVEEAAGVLKYKKRKEDTLKKLDKTNDNLERIGLIIDELSVNLEPLRKEAETATKYLNYKKELENTEVALLGIDIKNLNESYEKHKKRKEELSNEIETSNNTTLVDSSKVDSLKLKLLKTEENISKTSDELYTITNQLSSLNSEKQIMLEREKYKVDDAKLKNNVINLKEDELKLKNSIKSLKEEIDLKEKELKVKEELNLKLNNEFKSLNLNRSSLINDLSRLTKEEISLKNSIEIIKENINNDNKLPYAVKSVLNNHRLSGIHDALGKIVETEEKYSTAIDISLGYTSSVIVVDNETSAKEAISYLKQNGLGRATFYPINVIKPKGLDANTLNKIKDEESFIGVASDLVKYNPIYRNIVLNSLGNTIIIDNLTNANKISKIVNHLYRIVTLDGDLIAAGGSITGGSLKTSSGIINQKFELEKQIKLLDEKTNSIKLKEEEINDTDNNIKIMETKIFNSTNEYNSLKELLLRKYSDLSSLESSLASIQNEINGTNGLLNNSIDKEVEDILNKYYAVNGKKESLELKLNEYKSEKNDLQSEISELELATKKNNSEYNKKANELSNIEIEMGKEEIKLDNLLLRLNEEYNMTYEKAATFELSLDINEARNQVNTLKRNIKELGDVNTGSVSEYERVNTRYTFLTTQKNDLTASINDLLSVINELDTTMKDKLSSTFNELNKEFGKVFNKLFKGGEASLILTNPEDILNTGIEIKAIPPGKEIKNIKLLSGGESTLTAIALLFAILNIRTVPFCILDEVEAALDEPNVDMFGHYLKELDTNTEFIIITHKKRTMEYTDNLYGITMQESGVSKLVSVKLT
jgi:chromosome segregation protein